MNETFRRMLAGAPRSAHAIGVCGVGVAGVAAWLARKGWKVSGCDSHADGATADWLRSQGVAVSQGHDASHVDGCDLVIHTAAVGADHPEIRRAAELGIPTLRRGLALAALLDGCRAVAVCGTHGKTTTTTFTTRLLRALGDDAGWCIGGTAEGLDGFSGGGTRPDSIVVAESDESDGTLAAYHPHVLVVNNIEFDHMEHFDGEGALIECFASAARATRHAIVYGSDSPRAAQVAAASPAPSIGFGFAEGADMRATKLRMDARGTTFTLSWRGESLGEIRIGAPGRHNVLNAAAAAAVAVSLGHDPKRVAAAMDSLGGLPGRRFECLADAGDIRVVSDYSHHPTEIRALVETAKLYGAKRIVALFQPHRYTRTLALGDDFPPAFKGVDLLVLAPVFAASETPIDGGHTTDLYAKFRKAGVEPAPLLAPSLDAARDFLLRELRKGDMMLFIGAGDIVRTACETAEAIKARAVGYGVSADTGIRHSVRDFPLGKHTGYGVGGCADIAFIPESVEELAAALAEFGARGTAWRVHGAGMDTLVSDLGVPGVTILLDSPAFAGFAVKESGDSARTGEVVVEAGAGMAGAALLDRLEKEGLSGLEFLEGVPGRVGGFLAMNAGAHGGEIGARVAAIHCLNADGSSAIISGDDLAYGYRSCGGLAGRVAVSVELRLARDVPEAIRGRRAAARAKRIDLSGLRTCGSVFRNPPGASAGKLLDDAGCKGLRVGGAEVIGRHANVIAAGSGATASDVVALVDIARRRVAGSAGVWLEPEIKVVDRAKRPFA